MEQEIKEELERCSDPEGRVKCSRMLAIAKKFKASPIEVGELASNLGFRAKDCELGQFGRFENEIPEEVEDSVLEEVKKYVDPLNRVKCEDVWKLVKKFGSKKLRYVLRNNNIDVVYCQLGFFKEKKRPRLGVRTKVWIENRGAGMVFGKGKLQILELIDRMGSISAVADYLGVSYKKVWNHINTLEKNMNKKYVITTRGKYTGGSIITEDARELINKFNELQRDIEKYADRRFRELFYPDRKYRTNSN